MTQPAADQLVSTISPTDPEAAAYWWGDQPYGIACRVGTVFDVLDMPSWLGELVLPSVEHYATVVEVRRPLETRWQFFVTPGSPRIADLPRSAGVRLLTGDTWVLLPPTPTIGGDTRWVVRPPELKLPHSLCLQWTVVRAVTTARQRHAARRKGRAGSG